MGPASAVELSGVHKRYSRARGWVLRDVDLRVGAGRVAVVLGGNGDGKSTLLRIAAGVSVPTRGRVRRATGPVSYVPERAPSDLRMTADQYLRHLARLRGADLDRATGLLEEFRISPGPGVPIAQLSTGNRQKVVLAQAFGFPADLTVLDEPFGGLDRTASELLAVLIDRTRAAGGAVLISAHHPAGLEHSDALYRLAEGRLNRVPDHTGQARIVLRPNPKASAVEDLPHVIACETVPGGILVRTDDADALLRTALAQGWSFVSGQAP